MIVGTDGVSSQVKEGARQCLNLKAVSFQVEISADG